MGQVYLKRCFDAERLKNNNCEERKKSACFNSFNKMIYSNDDSSSGTPTTIIQTFIFNVKVKIL